MFDNQNRIFFSLAASIVFASKACVEAVLFYRTGDFTELYHPQHRPFHVTRLARLQHGGGYESLLEAEMKWSRGDVPSEERFHVSSPTQLHALVHHHSAVLAQRDVFNRERDVVADHAEHGETQGYLGWATSGTSTVTPLAPTKSLYIGPLGVGMTFPEGCDQWLGDVRDEARAGDPVILSENVAHRNVSITVTGDGEFVKAGSSARSCAASPETMLNVIYDTGSTNIWLASDLCIDGACVGEGRQRFNHTRSETFKYPEKPVEVRVLFGTGELAGPMGVDYLRVGPVTVRQPFLMIQNQDGRIWDDNPIEGIVGLGFPALATRNALPFFDSVIRQTALERNEFAFYLSRESTSSNALLWGGIDPVFYEGEVEYFPVIDPYYWSLELGRVMVGNETVLSSKRGHSSKPEKKIPGWSKLSRVRYKAIMDTGTTFVSLPSAIFSHVMDRLPAAPCSEVTDLDYPPITVSLLNVAGELRDFVLRGSDYMTTSENSEKYRCMPGLISFDLPSAHGPGIIIGDLFFRQYFSVFDRGDGSAGEARMGLAKARSTKSVAKALQSMTEDQPPFAQDQLRQMPRSA
eukprot:TRINITY_DN67355_c0_g1_i1.p1 TRINITY_DN67355_c0_g1~~TRINITY_DN67355_c0_g1_i1.p1  ORF type:complete len:577 (-),score=80.22 TRINITY_DN67355_c0_g1_i1:151-1881(-)